MALMARRMSEAIVRRPSLPLTAQDERDLEQVRSDPAYRAALARISPNGEQIAGDVGESVLLHALMQVGFAAVQQAAQDAGYAELAATYAGEDQHREARRRPPTWAHES